MTAVFGVLLFCCIACPPRRGPSCLRAGPVYLHEVFVHRHKLRISGDEYLRQLLTESVPAEVKALFKAYALAVVPAVYERVAAQLLWPLVFLAVELISAALHALRDAAEALGMDKRSGAIYEIELAKIYVAAGAVKIEQADITDMRADTSVCGWVAATVKEISLEQITAQFNDFFQSYNARISKLFAAYAAVIEDYENKGNIAYQNLLSAFSEFETGQESEFNTWFEKMKGQLSEDAAGNLQNQITALDSKIGNAIQDLSTKLVFSNLSKETGTIGITVTNTTTGTATKFDYSEGGKTYLTEPGEYTVSADSDSLMILPKKFTLDNAKTTETLTFKIYSRNAYAYVGGYVGAYVNKSN